MKIGIIGAGNVGGALGTGWTKRGHEVMFGFRDPAKPESRELAAKAGAKAGTQAEAAAFGEVVVVSLPWAATKGAVESLDLKGKIVLDTTNPLKPDLSGLQVGTDNSAGELVASWAKRARIVKVFNTTGNNNMADPIYGGEKTFMPYCGDDPEAKKVAAQLASDLGFDAVDAGPLSNARYLEPMAMLWIWLALKGGLGRNIAFQLLKR